MNVDAISSENWWDRNRGWSGLGLYPDEACYDPNRSSWLPYWIDNATEMACLSASNTFPGQRTNMPGPTPPSVPKLTTDPSVATPEALASGAVSVAGTDANGNTIYSVATTPQQTQQQNVQNLTNWAGNVTTATCGSFWSQAFGSGCTWGQNADCMDTLNKWTNPACGGSTSIIWIVIAAAAAGLLALSMATRR